MFHKWLQRIRRRQRSKIVNPNETFLDSSNQAAFNKHQFEGRIETPIAKGYLSVLKILFALGALIFVGQSLYLQVIKGESYAVRATRNNLKKEIIFAHRGIIADRNDVPLAWNVEASTTPFDKRIYTTIPGHSNLLGFVKYPKEDASGHLYSFSIQGQDGIEKYFDQRLSGENGAKLSEVSVAGKIESQGTLEPAINGEKIVLSIDSRVQEVLYNQIRETVDKAGFKAGAAVIMNVNTGEVLAMATYPGFDSNTMTNGEDDDAISKLLESKQLPFLDRVTSGLYTPGSIVKPYIATGVLQEKIIDPNKQIYTIGYLSVPNPYDPEHPTIFKDWKNHGYVDMRRAIAISSDVYFYIVGGGFGSQKGLGIAKIDEYLKKYLLGTPTEGFFAGPAGTIPTPEWKKATFDGEEWRVGNTYHTAIGQYGFQVTPMQIARAVTGLANEGTIVSPTILKNEQGVRLNINGIDKENYKIAKEGMRMSVTDTAGSPLSIPGISVAAKTGTAELGADKSRINGWVEGFFPYDSPRYVFALVLESGPVNAVGAMATMGATLTWMRDNTPEYIE